MRNHHEKARDMARSVLPSTARRSARARKQGAARRARARSNARLRRLTDFVDDLDAFEEPLDRYRIDLDDTGWGGMVDDRRAADKVAPLLRWATAALVREAGLDPAAARRHFAILLGDGLPGRHAMQHLEFDVLPPRNPYDGEITFLARLSSDDRTDDRPARLAAALQRVIADGLVGELNRAIKAGERGIHVHCDSCRQPSYLRHFIFTGDREVFLAGRRPPIQCHCGEPLADPGSRRAHRVLLRSVREGREVRWV